MSRKNSRIWNEQINITTTTVLQSVIVHKYKQSSCRKSQTLYDISRPNSVTNVSHKVKLRLYQWWESFFSFHLHFKLRLSSRAASSAIEWRCITITLLCFQSRLSRNLQSQHNVPAVQHSPQTTGLFTLVYRPSTEQLKRLSWSTDTRWPLKPWGILYSTSTLVTRTMIRTIAVCRKMYAFTLVIYLLP